MRISKLLSSAVLAAALTAGTSVYANDTDVEVGDVASDNQVDDGDDNVQNEDSIYVRDLLNGSFNDNAADSYSDDDFNGATMITAKQELTAININKELDEVVDLDGEDESDTAVGYNSGGNTVRGNAFAAYAGILNQAWNTGINANTQAATNIAAQGTVNFGANDAGGGNGGGGED